MVKIIAFTLLFLSGNWANASICLRYLSTSEVLTEEGNSILQKYQRYVSHSSKHSEEFRLLSNEIKEDLIKLINRIGLETSEISGNVVIHLDRGLSKDSLQVVKAAVGKFQIYKFYLDVNLFVQTGQRAGIPSSGHVMFVDPAGLLNFFFDDVADIVVSHELLHASFDEMKRQQKLNLYNRLTFYLGEKGRPFNDKNWYHTQLSFEEDYVHAADLFRILREAKSFGEAKKKQIYNKIYGLQLLFETSSMLTNKYIKLLERGEVTIKRTTNGVFVDDLAQTISIHYFPSASAQTDQAIISEMIKDFSFSNRHFDEAIAQVKEIMKVYELEGVDEKSVKKMEALAAKLKRYLYLEGVVKY